MANYDGDWHNSLMAEEKVYKEWLWEQRNIALKLPTEARRQQRWKELGLVIEKPDDSYLEGGIY
jgi:hypothetical protein